MVSKEKNPLTTAMKRLKNDIKFICKVFQSAFTIYILQSSPRINNLFIIY